MKAALARIRSRRAVLRDEIAATRLRLAARRRMVELELELARERGPITRVARRAAWLGPLLLAIAAARGPAPRSAAPAAGPATPWLSLLATLAPLVLRRLWRR